MHSSILIRIVFRSLALLGMAFTGCGVPTDAPLRDDAPIRDESLWGASNDKSRAVCGSGNYVHGIDVSKWQGTINWPMVAGSGVAYAFIRSSYGATGVDTTFDANWSGAKAAGLLRGAYHYFNPTYSGVTQATHMLAQFDDPMDLGELPIVVDVEESTNAPSTTVYTQRVAEFIDTIESLTGRTPMIYSGGSFWDVYVKSAAFADIPIWVAHYFNDRTTAHCPNVPNAWAKWTFWQHSEMGTVAGIAGGVDLDVFDGTYAQLVALGTPVRRAQYVAQSFPLASQGTLRVELGACVDASITLRNIGSAPWTASVQLALSSPRDQPIAAVQSPSWITPTRLDSVVGTVAVNATNQFTFEICGNVLGTHDVRFNLVDGSTWFSDAGQGGPSDTQLEGLFEVVPVGMADAGVVDAGGVDAGADGDGAVEVDPEGDGGVCSGVRCGSARRRGGCSVGVASRSEDAVGALALGMLVVAARGRARRRRRRRGDS